MSTKVSALYEAIDTHRKPLPSMGLGQVIWALGRVLPIMFFGGK